MYAPNQAPSSMAPPQKPETFMLSNEAQQSLPQDAQVALQQVDNREFPFLPTATAPTERPILEKRVADRDSIACI